MHVSALMLLVGLLAASTAAAQERLSDPKEIHDEVVQNFDLGLAASIRRRQPFDPKGITCSDVCKVFRQGACMEKGNPKKRTFGRFHSCEEPVTKYSKQPCLCDSDRRDFAIHYQHAGLGGTKLYKQFNGEIAILDAANLKVTRVKRPKVSRSEFYGGGPFLGFRPDPLIKTFHRLDTRTDKWTKTTPKEPDKWDRCNYVRGIGARAWFCRTKPDGKTHTFMFIDAETSKEHLLPNIDFDLLRQHSAAARWDGKRLVYARKLGHAEWDVRWWSPGQKQWSIMKQPDQPVEVDKPSEVSGIRIENAGVFADDIRSTSMASMAGMGPFHSARTGGEWAGDWVFLPTRKELLGFNVKTKKWLSWDIQRDVHRGLWAVGHTVVYDEFMLHKPTMTFRRLPPGLNAIWVGPYAVVHKTSCPIGKTCKKVADKGPFKDYAVWKPDVNRLSPKDPKLPRPR